MMGQTSQKLGNILHISHHHLSAVILLLLPLMISCFGSARAYQNYTVGDSLGWYDKLLKPTIDYHKWVSCKNFSLGDFLIFNTDNNHSVVQTCNLTTYHLCDFNNAQDNDTMEWANSNFSSTSPQTVSIAVPLVTVGMNYFFSGNYDGEQCMNGQLFYINVTYGQGLPPSLIGDDDSDDSLPLTPAASPESGDDVVESPPTKSYSSIFDNPVSSNETATVDYSKSISPIVSANVMYIVLLWLGIELFRVC